MNWMHYLEYWLGLAQSPQERIEKGIELVQRAPAVDDSLAAAHGSLSGFFTEKGA